MSASPVAELRSPGPIRSLPLRLEPRPGEALDSWLEALAVRADTAWGDMAAAVDIYRHDRPSVARRDWLVALAPAQQEALSVVTGVDTVVIAAMTLERFRGKAPIDSGVHTARAPLRWLHSYVSRYCPDCLAETGGRWQSWWRLKWAFACPTHLCLLADACPDCGGVQRHRDLPAGLIPTPGRCARKAAAARGRNLDRCGADLAAAPAMRLEMDHPAIHAQQVMLNAAVDDTVSYGIYAHNPVPVEVFLNDVRAVGRRILAYSTTDNLQQYVPGNLIEMAFAPAILVGATRRRAVKPRTLWASAATTAAAATAALTVLSAADIAEAGQRLHALVAACRNRRLTVSASSIGWAHGVSATLIGAQLQALAPFFGPTDQLRYRLSAPLPARPPSSRRHHNRVTRGLPALLWPALSVRFAQPHISSLQLRSSLSVAVSVVGTRLTLPEAAYLLGSVTTGAATSRILQILRASPYWAGVRAALTRLAGYLEENPTPIDYAARRALSYGDLLPDAEWAQICKVTATPVGRGLMIRLARCWLYERLSGSPAGHGVSPVNTAEFRGKLADFPRRLTPELLVQLDAVGRRFLERRGVRGEPVTWSPPAAIVAQLDLPGNEATSVDSAELCHLIRDEQLTISAAQRLGMRPCAIRHLLELCPLPMRFNATQRRARGMVVADARAALTRTDLINLYQGQLHSLADIAGQVGVSRQTISRLAHEYGIALRPPCRPKCVVAP